MSVSMLSPAAQRAVDRAMTTDHRVGRTVLRRDVSVMTSHMPTYGAYLTTVFAPGTILARLVDDERWSDTRAQAEATHEAIVAAVRVAIARKAGAA